MNTNISSLINYKYLVVVESDEYKYVVVVESDEYTYGIIEESDKYTYIRTVVVV